jgi:predicted nucleic acid-binding Zn ribbon protein
MDDEKPTSKCARCGRPIESGREYCERCENFIKVYRGVPVPEPHGIEWLVVGLGITIGFFLTFFGVLLYWIGPCIWVISILYFMKYNRTLAVSLLIGGVIGIIVYLGICGGNNGYPLIR